MPTKKISKIDESEEELKALEEEDEVMPLHSKQEDRADNPQPPLGEEPILDELAAMGYTEDGPGTPDDGDRAIYRE